MENLIILQNKIGFMIEQSRNIAISLIYDRKILIILYSIIINVFTFLL